MRAGFWEILLIVILILVLFGHAKIPEMMKNFAEGIKVFKKEIKSNDNSSASAKSPAAKTVAAKKPVKKSSPAKSTAQKKK